MKVKLDKDYRSIYTLEEYDMAKTVIAAEKDDEMSTKDWAEYAVREALRNEDGYLVEVLKAEARTARVFTQLTHGATKKTHRTEELKPHLSATQRTSTKTTSTVISTTVSIFRTASTQLKCASAIRGHALPHLLYIR